MQNATTNNHQKLLGRLSSLVQDSYRSLESVDSIIPQSIIMELATIKLPKDVHQRLQYFSEEHDLLLQIIALFRNENKVSVIFTIHRPFGMKIFGCEQCCSTNWVKRLN